MTSQGERFAEVTYCKCEFLLHSSSILAQKRSHIVASTMMKRWVAAGCGDKGSDGFRVASTTKQWSKESEGLRTQFRRLPEIQRRLEWRRFLDGCQRERRFPVAIATKPYSRTLLDSRPPEVCGYIERRGSDTHTGGYIFRFLVGWQFPLTVPGEVTKHCKPTTR